MRVIKPNQKLFNKSKIIHVDMDSFYASVEIKERPELKFKPVAVAGSSENRGVVTTCNYIARKFGIRSAMPSVIAKRLCPEIIFLPVNMEKYRAISKETHKIYKCYTKIIEPISLDEAYLDVTDSEYCQGDPEEMARQIRQKIFEDLGITASAGISSNKFLAKIASDWNKPNGQFSIPDKDIQNFILKVNIRKIYGVGEKTEIVLNKHRIQTCSDLQKLSKESLIKLLGKYGCTLYSLSRGIDNRLVEDDKISKSLSVEDTYVKDLTNYDQAANELNKLYLELKKRLGKEIHKDRLIKSCFIKVKFNDFKLITMQTSNQKTDHLVYLNLLEKTLLTNKKSIRLLGIGVQFDNRPLNQLNLDIS
ncbi:MAG: DNA polymerase-4 [Gammaproteobacteria bacterium]|jgi:DNA polymerase-4|tara:strand:- start:3236 stop:4324 length:1089 start_codon:yes stop_codon:yes gene_type:complete